MQNQPSKELARAEAQGLADSLQQRAWIEGRNDAEAGREENPSDTDAALVKAYRAGYNSVKKD